MKVSASQRGMILPVDLVVNYNGDLVLMARKKIVLVKISNAQLLVWMPEVFYHLAQKSQEIGQMMVSARPKERSLLVDLEISCKHELALTVSQKNVQMKILNVQLHVQMPEVLYHLVKKSWEIGQMKESAKPRGMTLHVDLDFNYNMECVQMESQKNVKLLISSEQFLVSRPELLYLPVVRS